MLRQYELWEKRVNSKADVSIESSERFGTYTREEVRVCRADFCTTLFIKRYNPTFRDRLKKNGLVATIGVLIGVILGAL